MPHHRSLEIVSPAHLELHADLLIGLPSPSPRSTVPPSGSTGLVVLDSADDESHERFVLL